MSRRPRSQIIELIKATMPWAEVSVQSLEPEDAKVYRQRKQALAMYLAGDTIASIQHATTVDGSYLRKKITSCLKLAPDGIVFGYRAFLPHFPTKVYERNKEVDTSHWQSGAGLSGVLGATFKRYPGLESALRKLILKKSVQKKEINGSSSVDVYEFSIRSKDVHVSFINLLGDRGHPKTEWPYNTKFLGLRTVTEYVKSQREQNFEHSVWISGDRGKIAHIPVGTGHSSLTKPKGLMDSIEIDSYKVDDIFILALLHENGMETLHLLKKLHVLAAVESVTRATLWYYVVHGDDVTAEDVVALIRQMLNTELPKPKFTLEGLELYPGAGFPADIIPEFRQSQPSLIKLDNALAHLANKVSSDTRKQLGCINEYGVPGRPERRPNIEHKFKLLATDLCQRFPNTTGAGPDQGRPQDPGAAAIKFRISSADLDQLVYALFANINAEPNEGLRFLTPLQAVAQLAGNEHYIPRLPPLDMRKSVGSVSVKTDRTVKGGANDGHRPYINFKRARYTSQRLMENYQLIGKKIIIEVNESDIRVLEAFLENGAPIGPLTVQGDWAELPHSLRTRNEINSLLHLKTITRTQGECIVATYMRHLKVKLETAEEKSKHDVRSATTFARLKWEQSRGSAPEDNALSPDLQQVVHLPPDYEDGQEQEQEPLRGSLFSLDGLDAFELVKKL